MFVGAVGWGGAGGGDFSHGQDLGFHTDDAASKF